ncbi:hypothetical protein PVAND_012602 [Polypedilum vanderplanki]|uniref:Uncharacterized protein n=1 Tax=Polypedilum vanderplanki TaxID=319348 RepID=A0A9J6CN10_POLVA|nr:hypothetical protein PVAND_012602 [Polypedilum vanderplanki]
MKSKISYFSPKKTGCCRLFNSKILALLSGIYTLNISILIVLMFGWQINANFKRYQDLGDVYYGIQIAQIAIIGTQCSMVILSIVLIIGIHKENANLVVPYIVGFLTLWSLETIALVYSNVLRDHIFKQFDEVSKAVLAFFVARAITNALAIFISDGSDDSSTTMSIYIDENENRLVYPNVDKQNAYQSTVHWHDSYTDDSELDVDNDVAICDEKILGDGSDEDDSLLVIYQDSDAAAY